MSFPNPAWIDDFGLCRPCNEHHPKDAPCPRCEDELEVPAPRWRPVEGRPGVWKHDDNDDCCVAELHAYECSSCGKQISGQHRVDACDHGEPHAEGHHGFRCHDLMTRVEHAEDGSPLWQYQPPAKQL